MGWSLGRVLGNVGRAVKKAAGQVASVAKKVAVPAIALGGLATGGALPAAVGGIASLFGKGKAIGSAVGGIASVIGGGSGKSAPTAVPSRTVAPLSLPMIEAQTFTPVPVQSAPSPVPVVGGGTVEGSGEVGPFRWQVGVSAGDQAVERSSEKTLRQVMLWGGGVALLLFVMRQGNGSRRGRW